MHRKQSSQSRRGVVVLVAMAVLAVVSMFVVMMAQLAVARHGALRAEAARMQARWLAESGVDRAVSRLASVATYRGEDWNLSAESLGGRDSAHVRIDVTAVPDRPDRRTVRVVADYPDDPHYRSRVTIEREMQVAMPDQDP